MIEPDQQKRVRIGVVGGGVWGQHHLAAAKQMEMEGYAQLLCIGAHSQETAGRVGEAYGIAGYTDFEEMISTEDLDLVTVATPDHLHRDVTLCALENDAHVLVEKPLDLTSSGCLDMIELSEKKDLLLMVDFHKRYDPYVIDIRNRIREEQVGDLYYGYFYMEDKITVPLKNLRKWAEESSPFWFVGVHKADLLRWITGQEVVELRARGYRGRLVEEGIRALDAVSVRLLLDGGFSCTIDVSWVIPKSFESLVNQGIRVVGSQGLIEADTQDRGLHFCTSEKGMESVNKFAYHTQQTMERYQAVSGYYVDPIKDFIRKTHYVINGGETEQVKNTFPSGRDGMIATRIAEAVAESIRSGERVKLL